MGYLFGFIPSREARRAGRDSYARPLFILSLLGNISKLCLA